MHEFTCLLKKNFIIEVQIVKKGSFYISAFTFWAQCLKYYICIFRFVVGKDVPENLNVSKIVNVGDDYNTDSLDSKVCTLCLILCCIVTEKYRELNTVFYVPVWSGQLNELHFFPTSFCCTIKLKMLGHNWMNATAFDGVQHTFTLELILSVMIHGVIDWLSVLLVL